MEKLYIDRVDHVPENTESSKILNINVGILGHIDSGKTSLAKRLSTIASTAAFDKNPQSRERGITLDLGFSAFYVKTPEHLKANYPENERLVNSEYLQLTLVDCPGHASLIKTVIAGANIIDTIVLVIDIQKGIQTQTTECLILGEILADKIIVALNKIDLLPASTREKDLENKILKLRTAFGLTKFGSDVSIMPVSAETKNFEVNSNENNIEPNRENKQEDIINIETKIDISSNNIDISYYDTLINNLIMSIIDNVDFNKKNIYHIPKKDFLFSIDHCFNIKNKGTIITGTILKGKVQAGDEIYFPELCEKKVIKEIQMFRKPISKAYQGDRIGMLIKNLDHTKIERSLACNEGYVQYLEGGLFLLKKIKFYKNEMKSGNKFYVTIGNQGAMAKCIFFNKLDTQNKDLYIDYDNRNIMNTNVNIRNFYLSEFDAVDYLSSHEDYSFCYLKFDQKMFIPPNMIALGSKIDFDVSYKSNRIAFYGKIIDTSPGLESKIKIFKMKKKAGAILRLVDDRNAIIKGLFKKDSNTDDFVGKNVFIGECDKIKGVILSKFGQSGKVKVEFNTEIRDLKLTNFEGKEVDYNGFSIILEYKKYIKIN